MLTLGHLHSAVFYFYLFFHLFNTSSPARLPGRRHERHARRREVPGVRRLPASHHPRAHASRGDFLHAGAGAGLRTVIQIHMCEEDEGDALLFLTGQQVNVSKVTLKHDGR